MLQRCHPMAYDVRCPVFTMPSVSKWASWWKPQVASLVLKANRRTETFMMPWNDNILIHNLPMCQGIFYKISWTNLEDTLQKIHLHNLRNLFFPRSESHHFATWGEMEDASETLEAILGILHVSWYGNLLYIFFSPQTWGCLTASSSRITTENLQKWRLLMILEMYIYSYYVVL